MRTPTALLTLMLAALAVGCNSSSPTPDQIRHDTAAATNTVVTDTKAAAEGIKDGVKNATSPDRGPEGHLVNINTGSRLNLMTLPGVSSKIAGQIIAHRPYSAPGDLLKRRIVTSDEYDQISPHITTSN